MKRILLAMGLAVVMFSHLATAGCSESSRLFGGVHCPRNILPQTLLQRFLTDYLPFAGAAAHQAFEMACHNAQPWMPFVSGASRLCDSVFAISYFAALAEWALYAILIATLVQWMATATRRVTRCILKIGAFAGITILVSRVVGTYGTRIIPSEHLPVIAGFAEKLVIQAAALLWGVAISTVRQIQQIATTDKFPGEALYQTTVSALGSFKFGWF